jgi:S-formylglutathione hydrolase
LIRPARDSPLWESNKPVSTTNANAQRIRDSGLAIYLEAGALGFSQRHDGAEFLHRLLWDLDLWHAE